MADRAGKKGKNRAAAAEARTASVPQPAAPAVNATASAAPAAAPAAIPSPFTTAPLVWADMTQGVELSEAARRAPPAPAVAEAQPVAKPEPVAAPAAPARATAVPQAPRVVASDPAPAAEAPAAAPPKPAPTPAVASTPTPAAAPTPERKSGTGAALAAGLVGAVLGGGALLAAAMAGWIPGLNRTGSTAPAATAEVRAIAERVGALEALRPRLEAAARPPAPDLAPIRTEMEQLRTALTGLQERIASLGTGAPGAPAAPPEVAGEVTRIGAAVTALGERVAAFDQRLGAVDQQLGQLGQRVSGIDLAPVTTGLDQLRGQVTALTAAQASAQREERAAALTLAGNSLRNAMARGGAFQTELEALRALGVSGPNLESLGQQAGGVPSGARLIALLRGVARPMIDAAQPPADSTLERIGQAASRLVSIRPSGETRGESTAATVSTIEARLQRNDFAGAKTAFDALPAAAKTAGAPFATELQRRLEAERLLRAVIDDIAQQAPPKG